MVHNASRKPRIAVRFCISHRQTLVVHTFTVTYDINSTKLHYLQSPPIIVNQCKQHGKLLVHRFLQCVGSTWLFLSLFGGIHHKAYGFESVDKQSHEIQSFNCLRQFPFMASVFLCGGSETQQIEIAYKHTSLYRH